MPDGRVDGLEIVRQRGNTDWAEPLLRSIRGRRYTVPRATSRPTGSSATPIPRIYEQVTGTRIPQRAPARARRI